MPRVCYFTGKKTTFGNQITHRGKAKYLGGVGTKPWRARIAEAALTGRRATADVFRAAAEAALQEAKSYGQNGFKIELAKRTLVRALTDLAGGAA